MPNPPARIEDYVQVKLGVWWRGIHKDIRSLGDILPADGKPRDGVRGPFQRIPSSRYARVFNGSVSLLGRTYDYFLKEYLHRSPGDFLKHFFRPTRAMRAFKASLLLARNGFDAPPVLAVGEYRPLLFCARCFAITSRIRNAPPVSTWLGVQLPTGDAASRARRRAFIRRLGAVVGRLHACGICHGDLRPGNVLVAETADDWRFFFLDNERTRAYRRLPLAMRVKNLVQIGMLFEDCLGRTDRMRFFKAYLRENPALAGRQKPLAAEVYARTRARLAGKEPDRRP